MCAAILMCVFVHVCQGLQTSSVRRAGEGAGVEKAEEVHTHHIETRHALILLEDIMRCQNTNINLIESPRML